MVFSCRGLRVLNLPTQPNTRTPPARQASMAALIWPSFRRSVSLPRWSMAPDSTW